MTWLLNAHDLILSSVVSEVSSFNIQTIEDKTCKACSPIYNTSNSINNCNPWTGLGTIPSSDFKFLKLLELGYKSHRRSK